MTTYEQMGIAALLPGMQFAIECMQRQLDEMRVQLAQMQNGGKPPRKARQNGRQGTQETSGLVNGWPADPVARSIEMKRRRAVARAKKKGPGSPAFAKKMSRISKGLWAGMTAKQRKERIANMHAARAAAKAAKAKTARLAVAS